MKRSLRIVLVLGVLGAAGFALALMVALGAYVYIAPSLPSVETLKEIQLQVPLRVYSRDGRLMAEFGEKRRIPVDYEDIPPLVVQSFLAAEDDRFFDHPGVDYQGIIRAAFNLLQTGEITQGGSTITMQLARNYFLTREKTWRRKLREVFLAIRIEREFTKEEILTLYLNKIFLGQRAYGVGAAAEVYYGKTLPELTLAETAMIAGLPAAPSAYNPISNFENAERRRAYVLRRMNELGFTDTKQYEDALTEPVKTFFHGPTVEVSAPYVAEMVREEALLRFGDEAYTAGYRVTTTIDSRLQRAADIALRKTLHEYDERHGYRGPIARLEQPQGVAPDVPQTAGEGIDENSRQDEREARWLDILDQYPVAGRLTLGLVTDVGDEVAAVFLRSGENVVIPWEGLSWAREYIDDERVGPEPEVPTEVLAAGDVIYLHPDDETIWRLASYPEVQGALVALDPLDGAIVALSGGYDFYVSKFNRVTQARRQPGSAFKPFVYSAALENGFTPATIVIDAPVVLEDPMLEKDWKPDNYERRFNGPTRLRMALIKSLNLVSVRVLQQIGIVAALRHLEQFGFSRDVIPADLTLALGSATLSPLDLAAGYTVLADGGYRIEPYFIQRVEGPDGLIEPMEEPLFVCRECRQPDQVDDEAPIMASLQPVAVPEGAPATEVSNLAPRTIDERNVFLIVDMMRDVIRRGTGRRALALGRNDIAGKTGTTNDVHDAWFSGFNGDLVATAWVGFDQARPLGRTDTGIREQGGVTALPMWMRFMEEALEGTRETKFPAPDGLVTVKISAETGELAGAGDPDAILEIFRSENVPEYEPTRNAQREQSEDDEDDTLF